MGATTIPAVTGNAYKWVSIASSTPSGVASVTFSSIPEYNYLLVTYHALDLASANVLNMRLNAISTNTEYSWGFQPFINTDTYGAVSSNANEARIGAADNSSGEVLIIGANQPRKIITFWSSGGPSGLGGNAQGAFVNGKVFFNKTESISQIEILVPFSTFNAGTINVYGSN